MTTLTPVLEREDLIDLGILLKVDRVFMEGIRRGLIARREGRMVPWNQVKAELGIK